MIRRLIPVPLKDRLKRWEFWETLAWITRAFPDLGALEPEIEKVVPRLVGQGGVCVDVGANVGELSAFMGRRVGTSGRVIAFEPIQRNARILARRLRHSPLQEVVTLERLAVMDQDDEVVLLYPHSGRASVAWSVIKQEAPQSSAVTAPSVRLDTYLRNYEKVDLIAIDVEGAERFVLAGMKDVMRRLRPSLLIEFHRPDCSEEVGLIRNSGYELLTCEGQPFDTTNPRLLTHYVALPSTSNS